MSVQEFLNVFKINQQVKIIYYDQRINITKVDSHGEIKEYAGTISYLANNHHDLFNKEIVVSYAKNDCINILI